MPAGFAGVVSAPHSVLALVAFGAGGSVVPSPDLAFTVCSPVERGERQEGAPWENIRGLGWHPPVSRASGSSICCSVGSLLPRKQGAVMPGMQQRGCHWKRRQTLGFSFPGHGNMEKSVETQWKLVLRAWYVLGVQCLHHPAQTACEGWFRTTLNWHQHSSAQQLHSPAAKAVSCAPWPQGFEQGLLHLLCQPEIPPGCETEMTPPS